MATKEKRSARNYAAVRYLKGVKASLAEPMTYEQIAEATGIPIGTVKNLMSNRSDLSVDQFLTIAAALRVSNRDALSSLADVVFDEGL